ncbi:GNAT family N-acetyltransferase [Candidatus Gracilibacteria bacterium]|nr:GNAT family N-acetyltransferase [Candidatus Gracilibacteria bacterium]
MEAAITFHLSPPLSNTQLNALFAAAWPSHTDSDFAPVLSRSLVYVAAFNAEQLIGFVNVAWDGGVHAFLLDTTVHPGWQRRGIGTGLVQNAVVAARAAACEWLHVDYEDHLEEFYQGCGFRLTQAGLINLRAP